MEFMQFIELIKLGARQMANGSPPSTVNQQLSTAQQEHISLTFLPSRSMDARFPLLRNGLAIMLLVLLGFVSMKLWVLEREKREVNADRVHLSDIRYGLFNVDAWKKVAVDLISKNIEEFNLNPRDRQRMRKKVSGLLTALVDDFEERYHQQERHREGGFLEQTKGALRSAVVSGTKLFEHMREDIPVFTEQILDFVSDPENAEMLKEYLTEKLDTYAAETFSETDYTLHDRLLEKYGAADRNEALARMDQRMAEAGAHQQPYRWVFFGLLTGSLLLILLFPLRGKVEYLVVVAACFLLLWLGLTLPMLEIDARIAKLSFQLLGEEVAFTDQVVYHKSKSILEVVTLMVQKSDLKVAAVGLLILLFSVLFPVSKLLGCVAYLFSGNARNSKVVRFLVFRTGKWSMADVLVVAIFMSYIGFSGILNEQLAQLQQVTATINLLTTNHSTLLFGFYAFVGFVLMGLLLAWRLESPSQPPRGEAP